MRLRDSRAFREIKELVLPRGLRCVYCGAQVSARAECVCASCRKKLIPAARRTDVPFVDELGACFVYASPADDAIKRYKYDGKRYIARHMALMMAKSLPEGTLMPVPAHERRVKERGFDHSAELACELSFLTGRPLLTGTLVRMRYTTQQALLSGEERRTNIKDAFALTTDALPEVILLVDDVVSTGATLGECAKTLKSAGVRRVNAAAFAAAGFNSK